MPKQGLFHNVAYFDALLPQRNRSFSLDVLRGIAICGIVFLNAPFFINFDYGYVAIMPEVATDSVLLSLQVLLLDGRFRGLFLVLFALGLVIQWQRIGAHTQPYHPLRARLCVLLILGCIHSFFIWAGDILLGYALAGLIAITMIEDSPRRQLINGMGCFAIGTILLLCLGWLSNEPLPTYSSPVYQQYLDDFNPNFLASRVDNAHNAVLMLIALLLGVLWLELGVILMTISVWRSGWLVTPWPQKHKALIGFVCAVCLVVSAFKLTHASGLSDVGALIANSMSGFLTALIVIHCVTFWPINANKVTYAFACVGKMSLSCYLGQSLIMVILNHFHGEIFARQFYLHDYLLLSTVIMVFMLVFCPFYLRLFKQGPIEKVWRALSLKYTLHNS
ncbi:DUF418 domain-containing protein [Pseudoalteromonas sp. SSDWG2]|uniref:DUF418 domain-containing protein n=1 Tax=Pseudoalteromonas sp. SSDWG2 TaxID=3139391 RepID=UPI003BAC29EB